MSDKLLTVAIPTWNRANLLDELLKEITVQLKETGLDSHVQLLVSNNASTDHTDAVVKEYIARHPFISYNVNPVNTGAKNNVLKSMELAETPYVMFIGDDDRISVKGLQDAITSLKSINDIGLLLDVSRSKYAQANELSRQQLQEFLALNFYYMGNAGFFITRTSYIKQTLARHGYAFLNECWPQTQCMILGLLNDSDHHAYTAHLSIPRESLHDQVMVYTSYYLWRTTVYDLMKSLIDIRNYTGDDIYYAAKRNFDLTAKQNFFNILQCGVFVDDAATRKLTVSHIGENLHLFSGKNKWLFLLVKAILQLPASISKPASDIFIYLIRGSKGIRKKNDFVTAEHNKKRMKAAAIQAGVRKLEFEK